MADVTAIEWCEHTFNPWIGCSKVSPGCAHCYAEVDTFPRASRARGLELWGPKARRHVTSEANWRKPLAWAHSSVKAGVRARVFCASLADVFEDREDLLAPRARLFDLIAATPRLDWLLLTKRPENADRLWTGAMRTRAPGRPLFACESAWLPNLWLGTSIEDQARADERIQHLLATPARVRFLSCEPLLGPLDLLEYLDAGQESNGPAGWVAGASIDWVIVGGESNSSARRARPCDLAWMRTIVQQCRRTGVPVFVKQVGDAPYESVSERTRGLGGVGLPIKARKGGDPAEWPDELRVRQWPEASR